LSSKIGRANATFLNFYVSHGSAIRQEILYFYFVDNSLQFLTAKIFFKIG